MAEVEEAIFTRLSGYAGLVAQIGTRIYALTRPQVHTLPCVVYERTGEMVESALSEDTDLAHPTIAITAFGTTYASAKAVARQVREALQRWADPASTPVVLDALLRDSTEDYDGDEGDGVYLVSHSFEVWYRDV